MADKYCYYADMHHAFRTGFLPKILHYARTRDNSFTLLLECKYIHLTHEHGRQYNFSSVITMDGITFLSDHGREIIQCHGYGRPDVTFE